jgi:hypothetical protein
VNSSKTKGDDRRPCQRRQQQPREESTSCEKPGICAGGPNSQSDRFGALGTVALVGGRRAVDIDPRIDVAADEVNPDESAAGGRRFSVFAAAGTDFIREIEVLAIHGEFID